MQLVRWMGIANVGDDRGTHMKASAMSIFTIYMGPRRVSALWRYWRIGENLAEEGQPTLCASDTECGLFPWRCACNGQRLGCSLGVQKPTTWYGRHILRLSSLNGS
jgi:hypothetical protein